MEQHYVFLKGNRVMDISVFASQDEELADAVARERGFDDAVWVGDNKPTRFSTWDGATFTEPTIDDLYDLGILPENTAMIEARLAAQAAKEITE